MADKGKKRKAFEIPVLSELEEAVDVSPVFNRLKKTQNQAAATSNSRAKSTASENDVLKDWKLSIDLDRNPGLKDTDRDETVEEEEIRTAKEPDTVHVGRNFIETFAFIEKTKHYQEPKPLTTASNFSESASESTTKQEVPLKATNPNAVIVSLRQKGNPVLKFFRNVPWEYGDIIPDYVMGPRMCALYLSVRYHNFNPDYIHDRLKKLGNRYELRILLVQVDTKDPHKTLKELTKIAILADCTLILAWSHEEVARYIEMYKIYENKPPDVLQGQTSTDYLSKLTDCLTTVKSVNRTDTVTLLSTFQTLESIISASTDDIALCPGFGPQKAKRLHDAFHQSFITSKTSSKGNRTGSKT